jgi:hypothetical protein
MRTLSTRFGLNGPLGGYKKEASHLAPSLISDFIGQKLQPDETMQPGILGFVNDAHPAAA